VDRRTWVRLSVAGALASAVASIPFLRRLRVRILPVTDHERQTLTRVVDLLVPSDDTPGAIDLGIDRSILARFEATRQEARRLADVCLALDRLARGLQGSDFLSAAEAAQIEVITGLMVKERNPAVARALRALRRQTMTLYYSRPESWTGLGIHAPPQPAGYPDYADPPSAGST